MQAKKTIPLCISGDQSVHYKAWPVTQGIPFADGVLESHAPVRVLDENGMPLSTQSRCLATWNKDMKYVKWLLIDFQVDLAAGQQRNFLLDYGPDSIPPPPRNEVVVKQAEDHVAINTGTLRVILRNRSPHLQSPADRDFFAECLLPCDGGWRNILTGNPGPFLYMRFR